MTRNPREVPDEEPDHSGSWTGDRVAIYRDLLGRAPEDELSLSDLVARHGPSVLDRDVPYLLVAIRNQTRSRLRRAQRGRELEDDAVRVLGPIESLDPARVVLANEELRATIEAMASLDPRDAWSLWWHVAGDRDDDIVVRWDQAGFEPASPSTDFIRKRRERARQALRARVAEWRRSGDAR